MEKPSKLYHGSPNKNIEVFEPKVSHGTGDPYGKMVYASPDLAVSSIFLAKVEGRWSAGRFGNIPYALITVPREQFIEKDEGGVIYVLPNDTFDTDPERGLGEAEWASPEPVVPTEKIEYSSALDAMLENGIQVYFLTPEKHAELKELPDKGRAYLSSIESENQHRGINIKEFHKEPEIAEQLSAEQTTPKRNELGGRPEKLQLEGRDFEFVTGQRGNASAVYKSPDAYMRIGEQEKIHIDLELHKRMEEAGFPVAKLIAEGESDGQAYFLEASLGEKHLGKIFAEDTEKDGHISPEAFEGLIGVAELFGTAQLKTQVPEKNYNEFAEGIHVETLCDELPEYADKIRARFEELKARIAAFPFVITHGDFNANNLYPGGVIDLEDSFHGPFGYDLIGGISHINYFPDSRDYEYFARHRFTPEQKQEYLARMDKVSTEAGLPPLSEFEEDFEFCRAVWLCGNNPNTPKLRQFRYDLIVSKFLS